LNKLKIDYDLAKEQYLNMTQAKKILGKYQERQTPDDLGQDDSLKEGTLTILQINLTKNQNTCFR
jgi:ATP-dependent Clp protease ATP-binding subunit ClpC